MERDYGRGREDAQGGIDGPGRLFEGGGGDEEAAPPEACSGLEGKGEWVE